jgi:hypothetical protein
MGVPIDREHHRAEMSLSRDVAGRERRRAERRRDMQRPQAGVPTGGTVIEPGNAAGWTRRRTGCLRAECRGAQTLSRRVTPSGGTPRSGNAVGLWSAGRWERLRVGKWPDVDRRRAVKDRRRSGIGWESAGRGVPSGGPLAGRGALPGGVPSDGNAADRSRWRGVGHREEPTEQERDQDEGCCRAWVRPGRGALAGGAPSDGRVTETPRNGSVVGT